MSVWTELLRALVEYGKALCVPPARSRSIWVSVALGLMVTILSLWGLGLLIAGLFIGLAPHVGAAWAAVIAAGATFFLAAVLALIAMLARR